MRALILACALVLGGCGSTPYAEIGVAYQLEGMTDYWLQGERTWQCDKGPKAEIEIGVELEGNWQVGYHHQSWYACGKPFNKRPEVYQDDIRITKKFGGK